MRLLLLAASLLLLLVLLTLVLLLRRLSGAASTTATAGAAQRLAEAGETATAATAAAATASAAASAATEQAAAQVAAQAAAQAHREAQREAQDHAADLERVRDRASAETARQEADTEAALVRRRADAEADAARRALHLAAQTAAQAAADQLRTQVAIELARQRDETTAARTELERREQRLSEREDRDDAERQRLAAAALEVSQAREALEAQRAVLVDLQADRTRILEQAAAMSRDEAKAELIAVVEQQAKREAALTVRSIEAEAREQGEARARGIVADAVQRVASEQTSESVVTVLHLPSDEMKGRIIGREGRNIRSFESVTGVNVVIDDTPEAVLLSCFDPVRREIGRLTLEKLVLDGRIHPHRIEELHERAKAEVEASCRRAGEDALVQVGITDVHPDLVDLLGRLRLRTSYGQNVLRHLVETAHIASHMASELGVNPALVKRGAFFHDIGKALTHEVEGSHATIGADLARRYGERDEVIHAIAAHHGEITPETIEAVLTQASDSCSGGRPGARRESIESYVQRLQRIEEIASAKPGVERVFAMQAGREVRVMVVPEEVDDLGALVLAREVAKQIEEELTYPGQIRVTVVRESRATEIAH